MNDRSTVTLEYANPVVGQPLSSLSNLEWLPDGVELTRPVQPSLAGAVTLFVVGGATLFMALTCVGGLTGGLGHRYAAEWAAILVMLAALIAIACASFCLGRQLCRCRTMTLALRRRELKTANGVMPLSGRPWRTSRIRRFSVSAGQPELPTLRVVAFLRVSVRFGFARKLKYALPREECVWAARLLNEALASRPTT